MEKIRKTKKNKIVSLLFTLLVMCSCFSFQFMKVKAEEDVPISVEIPISCIGENTDETFTYKLTPNENNKQHYTIKSDTLSLKNSAKGAFEVEVSKVGNYLFTIEQSKGSDSSTTYDSTSYIVNIDVVREEDGLEAVVLAYKNDSDTKSEIEFKNVKKVSPASTSNTKTDQTNNEQPSQVNQPTIFGKRTGVEDTTKMWIQLASASVVTLGLLIYLKKKASKKKISTKETIKFYE